MFTQRHEWYSKSEWIKTYVVVFCKGAGRTQSPSLRGGACHWAPFLGAHCISDFKLNTGTTIPNQKWPPHLGQAQPLTSATGNLGYFAPQSRKFGWVNISTDICGFHSASTSFHCLSVGGRSLSICLSSRLLDLLFSSSEVFTVTSISFPLPVSVHWMAGEVDGPTDTGDRNEHRWERLRSL